MHVQKIIRESKAFIIQSKMSIDEALPLARNDEREMAENGRRDEIND